MKKLMIAVAAVAMAIVANAAQVKWNTGDAIYAMNGTDKATGYLVYFMVGGDAAQASTEAVLAQGLTTGITPDSSKTTTNGKASATYLSDAPNSATYTGYLVIFNADTIANATYAYITGTVSATTGASGQAGTLSWKGSGLADGTQVQGNWYAIPEPTSGLLMLIGMAGLALRRRRA